MGWEEAQDIGGPEQGGPGWSREQGGCCQMKLENDGPSHTGLTGILSLPETNNRDTVANTY